MFYLRRMMMVAMLAEDGRGDRILSLISFVIYDLRYIFLIFFMRKTLLRVLLNFDCDACKYSVSVLLAFFVVVAVVFLGSKGFRKVGLVYLAFLVYCPVQVFKLITGNDDVTSIFLQLIFVLEINVFLFLVIYGFLTLCMFLLCHVQIVPFIVVNLCIQLSWITCFFCTTISIIK